MCEFFQRWINCNQRLLTNVEKAIIGTCTTGKENKSMREKSKTKKGFLKEPKQNKISYIHKKKKKQLNPLAPPSRDGNGSNQRWVCHSHPHSR